MHLITFFALVLSFFGPLTWAGQAEEEIATRLIYSVQMQQPPEIEGDGLFTVNLEVMLIDVVRADPATNQVELVLWTTFEWQDDRLKFAGQPHTENVTQVHLKSSSMWKPDVVVYRQTAPTEDIYPERDNILTRDGKVRSVPSGKFRVSCDLTGLETSQGAECAIKFGSWTHNGDELDLQFINRDEPKMDLSYFFPGSKYDVVKNEARRNVIKYSCCPEPYVDLEYRLTIRTKGSGGYSFFGFN